MPLPGFTKTGKHQSDGDRDRRRREVVKHRLATHPPEGAEISQARCADDQTRDDQRNDNHSDETNERDASGLELPQDVHRRGESGRGGHQIGAHSRHCPREQSDRDLRV